MSVPSKSESSINMVVAEFCVALFSFSLPAPGSESDVFVLAAAEAAVALAIVINIYNNLHTINIDEASGMKE